MVVGFISSPYRAASGAIFAGCGLPPVAAASSTSSSKYFLTLHPAPELNLDMERHIHADRRVVAELDELLAHTLDPALDRAAGAYAQLLARSRSDVAAVRRLVRLGLDFGTWELLTASGDANDAEAARLICRAVAGLGRSSSRPA